VLASSSSVAMSLVGCPPSRDWCKTTYHLCSASMELAAHSFHLSVIKSWMTQLLEHKVKLTISSMFWELGQ
jgi:hypothetical protein